MDSENSVKSEKIKNYAMASFFGISTIVAIMIMATMAASSYYNPYSPNIWSECNPETNTANVFITAMNEDLSNVKCTAVEKEFFANPEISLGDILKNDETVCKFKLTKNTTEPLSFEISYNGKTTKKVCNWWNPNSGD